MSEEDIKEYLDTFLKPMLAVMTSMNTKLGQLIIDQKVRMIREGLQVEDKVEKSSAVGQSGETPVHGSEADSKALTEKNIDPEIMDLTEVTVIAHTEKAILVTKKGFQKWVPLSFVVSDLGEWDDGIYLDIKLTDKGGWINKKAWSKLEVRKS